MSNEHLPVKAPRRALSAFCAVLILTVLVPRAISQVQGQAQDPAARFNGVWTGMQQWKATSPSPYSREGQPVSLEIKTVGGKTSGAMTPFLGGVEGATFSEARISGNQLRATGIVGVPRDSDDPADWKHAVAIAFEFTLDGNNLAGVAHLKLGDVQWLKLEYRLSRQ